MKADVESWWTWTHLLSAMERKSADGCGIFFRTSRFRLVHALEFLYKTVPLLQSSALISIGPQPESSLWCLLIWVGTAKKCFQSVPTQAWHLRASSNQSHQLPTSRVFLSLLRFSPSRRSARFKGLKGAIASFCMKRTKTYMYIFNPYHSLKVKVRGVFRCVSPTSTVTSWNFFFHVRVIDES